MGVIGFLVYMLVCGLFVLWLALDRLWICSVLLGYLCFIVCLLSWCFVGVVCFEIGGFVF